MEQLVRLYRDSHLGKRLPAYDGRKSLYTAGPLPFISKDFRITLVDEDDGSGGQRCASCSLVLFVYLHCQIHPWLFVLFNICAS